MQIVCFLIAAAAVFLGLVQTFSTWYGSGSEPLAVSLSDKEELEQDGAPEDSTTGSTTASSTSRTTLQTIPVDEPSLIGTSQPSEHSAKYFIVVYKASQSVVVYSKDKSGNYTKKVKSFTCSTGKSNSPTPTGTYRIRAKYRWRLLEGNVYGQYNSSISENYLFHSVPYIRKDASTLDDSEYDKLGTPASKGCVRLCVRDCKWIYDNCAVGTTVRIVNDSGPSGSGVPERKTSSDYSGWDPSDKWAEGNPYFDE